MESSLTEPMGCGLPLLAMQPGFGTLVAARYFLRFAGKEGLLGQRFRTRAESISGTFPSTTVLWMARVISDNSSSANQAVASHLPVDTLLSLTAPPLVTQSCWALRKSPRYHMKRAQPHLPFDFCRTGQYQKSAQRTRSHGPQSRHHPCSYLTGPGRDQSASAAPLACDNISSSACVSLLALWKAFDDCVPRKDKPKMVARRKSISLNHVQYLSLCSHVFPHRKSLISNAEAGGLFKAPLNG